MATRKKARQTKKETPRARHQAAAIILFAVAILLLCIVCIPGQEGKNLWYFLHLFIKGMFGICAYVLPVLLGYIAVIAAMERPIGSISAKLWQCVALLTMVDSAIYIFSAATEQAPYFQSIAASYKSGCTDVFSSGVFGTLLGHPMVKLFPGVGAKIIICLLIFVFLMLVTGTTIIALFKTAAKPVKKTKESIESAVAYTEEYMERSKAQREERRRAHIDIDLGEGYEEKSRKQAEKPQPAEPPAPPAPPAPSDEALHSLKKAAEELQETAVPAKKETKTETPPEELREEADGYRFPPLSLLDEPLAAAGGASAEEVERNGELLVSTLRDFGISTRMSAVTHGPAVTRYELEPSAGVKISRITGLSDDIALRLATTGVRIEAPIPNKAAVGIEIPNKSRNTVCLRELLDTPQFAASKGKLTVALGKDIEGGLVLADLAKMPHLLIAGTTGSGKSVCTNSMIQSVLYHARPDEVKMILIDPKQVEFGVYNGIPHLLIPVVTDPRKAAGALGWAVNEMLHRYKLFAENNVRDLTSYNALAQKSETLHPMPLILIVIDELADLMMAAASEVEDSIIRLAQMARAAGMHMVIATQRPSVDVITGLIKANIPSRLALTVASAVDSRTILDAGGAEKLLGYGDMLFMPVGRPKPCRVQGCFVSNREVESVVEFLKSADRSETDYDQSILDEIDRQAAAAGKTAAKGDDDEGEDGDWDDMLPQAIEAVVEAGMASTSMLQRRLRLGYARAGRIIDQLEQKGIIGPYEGSKPRQVLITRQQWLEMRTAGTDADTTEQPI